jgi:hypothetical protein
MQAPVTILLKKKDFSLVSRHTIKGMNKSSMVCLRFLYGKIPLHTNTKHSQKYGSKMYFFSAPKAPTYLPTYAQINNIRMVGIIGLG